MKILFLCISIAIFITKHTDAVVAKDDKLADAVKAKKEYEDGKQEDADFAMKRIQEMDIDEDKFGKLLTWIRDAHVCLRRGTEAKNAAYALSDFDLDLKNEVLKSAFWFAKPYTRYTEKTNLWYERLYNSIAKILLSESSNEAPLLLATMGGDAGGEKYPAVNIGIGDTKSFGKTQVKGKKIGKDFKLNAQESLKDLPGAVGKILKWIEETFDEELKNSD